MHAMILAAGRGTRMRPLTDSIPKPLVTLKGRPLIEHNLLSLKKAGIQNIVINLNHLSEQVITYLGDGTRYGLNIQYSIEPDLLDTGGGVKRALPWLGNQPFLVISSDIYTEFDFTTIANQLDHMAHLVLVDNPLFHPQGDFALHAGLVTKNAEPKLTYANIGIFHPCIFDSITADVFPLSLVIEHAITVQQVSGEYYQGFWHNIGTLEQLSALEA